MNTFILGHAILTVRINIFTRKTFSAIRIGSIIEAGGTFVGSSTSFTLLVEITTLKTSLSLKIILFADTLGTFVHC